MSHYQFIPYDWTTGVRLDPLPLGDVTFSIGMNAGTTASATLPLKDSAILNALRIEGTQPRKHLIVIERGGLPKWAGAVWTRSYDSVSQVLTLAMTDLTGWMAQTTRSPKTTYTAADYFDIVRDQISNINGLINDLIVVDPAATDLGQTTSFTIQWEESRAVTDVIKQVAEKDDGFDWRWDYAWSGTDLVPTFTMASSLGRTVDQTNLVLEVGKNVNLLSWSEEATEAADTIWVTGAGNATEVRRATASDTSFSSAGFLPLTKIIGRKTLQTNAECLALAKAVIAQRAQAGFVLPQVAIQGDQIPRLGDWVPGDETKLIIRPSTDPRWPNGINQTFRMMGATIAVGNEGQELTTINLAPTNTA